MWFWIWKGNEINISFQPLWVVSIAIVTHAPGTTFNHGELDVHKTLKSLPSFFCGFRLLLLSLHVIPEWLDLVTGDELLLIQCLPPSEIFMFYYFRELNQSRYDVALLLWFPFRLHKTVQACQVVWELRVSRLFHVHPQIPSSVGLDCLCHTFYYKGSPPFGLQLLISWKVSTVRRDSSVAQIPSIHPLSVLFIH